jgi:hypothetical protein
VRITGTPQFDFHIREEFHWSKDETARRIGLDPSKHWLLYAANFVEWTPTEPELVGQIYTRLRAAISNDSWQLVVRLHPMDDPARWADLFAQHPQLKLCLPWDAELKGRKDLATLDNQRCLVSLLRHSAVSMNMASTMSLDAAILDRPVIGIAYGAHPGSLEHRQYADFHSTEHYAPLVESGAIRMVYSHDDLCRAVQTYLAAPETDRGARQKLIAAQCGPVDGKSTERIANFLLSRLDRNTKHK